MTTETTAAPAQIHRFEARGLGKAPFRVIGSHVAKYQACPGAPIQPGSMCDYCGTCIMQVFVVRSADGKLSNIGCDCIASAGDAGLKRAVDKVKTAAAADKRAARSASDVQALDELLADPATRARLAALPHPRGFAGETLLTQAEWMRARAGAAGRGRILKALREALAA